MFEELLNLIKQANSNYSATYDESKAMNVKTSCIERDAGFAYIEEFTQGSYKREKFVKNKTTKVQIYFCRFTEIHNEASEREKIRQQIETEIVLPFIDLYDEYAGINKPLEYRFVQSLPRFDDNEVSIMLEFDVVKNRC